jgi:HYR domain
MRKALLLSVVVIALMTAAGATGSSKRALGTLEVKATLLTSRAADAAHCPPGASADSSCFRYVGKGTIPGLGQVTSTYTKVITRGDADCEVRFVLDPVVLEVAGRGAVELSRPERTCFRLSLPVTIGPLDVTVARGSGAYAGASGSMKLTTWVSQFDTPASRDTWTGTLSAPGVDFDVTPPVISGAVSKTVKTPQRAKRVRVRYSVTARDAVDGRVPVFCTPGSGSSFKLGRTSVFCSATDASANVRRARFTVTVRR